MSNDNRRHISDRRTFLKRTTSGAVAVGTIGLAGCSGDGGNGSDGSDGSDGGDGGDGSDGSDGGNGGDGEDGGSDYPSEEITWKNGGSAGGGFDQYSQAISQFMPGHLPNEVEVRVETMGSWTQANRQIYESDPDGYTLGIVNIPGNVVTQVLQDPPWDLTELSWFGRIARSVYAMSVASDSGFESWQDLRDLDRPAKFATTGQGTSMLSTILGATALEIDFELVTGYAGSPEMVTGVLRGDADALQLPATTTPMANALEEGEMIPLLYYGEDPTEYGLSEDVPTVIDEGFPELEGQANLQRCCAAPPDTPDEIVSALEQSLDDTVHSDEFQAWAEEQGRPVDHGGADFTTQAVNDAHSFIQENQDVFAEYL